MWTLSGVCEWWERQSWKPGVVVSSAHLYHTISATVCRLHRKRQAEGPSPGVQVQTDFPSACTGDGGASQPRIPLATVAAPTASAKGLRYLLPPRQP